MRALQLPKLNFYAIGQILMNPITSGLSMSLLGGGSVGRRVLAFDHVGNPNPSLRHAVPSHLVLRIGCEFCHKLAFCGKS
jgi:hypothetical protein